MCKMYPEAKSVGLWLKHGWHVAIAYVIGFFVMLAILEFHPNERHKRVTPHAAADALVAYWIAAPVSGS